MKLRDEHRRDFWAYVWFNRQVNGRFGNPMYWCPAQSNFDRGTVHTIKCFVEQDSTGKMKNRPKQPRLLKLALDGKKLLNWHIEQWGEGLADGHSIPWEFREYLLKLPDWVCVAFLGQWKKIAIKKFETGMLERPYFGAYNLMLELLQEPI